MRKKSISLLLLVLFYLFESFICAQELSLINPNVIYYPKKEYGAGTQNWGFDQAKTGLLYVANNKGLLEYDGNKWKIYPLPNQTIVRSIKIVEDSIIYVGGQNEFGYFAPDKAGGLQYVSLSHAFKPKNSSKFEDVWKIFKVEDKIIFCTEKNILITQNGILNQIISPHQQRFTSFFKIDDKLWVQEDSLYQLIGTTLEKQRVESFPLNSRVVEALKWKEDKHLIFTEKDGIGILQNTKFTPWSSEASKILQDKHIYSVLQLKNGQIAIGTVKSGLYIISSKGKLIKHYSTEDKTLKNNTVLSIFEDQYQNLWLGLDNGINYLEINITFTKLNPSVGINGTGYAVNTLDSILYVGTNQGLFKSTNAYWSTPPKFEAISSESGQIWSISNLDNSLYIGKHEGASLLKSNQIMPFSNTKGAWKFHVLNSNPSYALEGAYSGFKLYQKEGKEWVFIKKLEGFDESARVFEEDEKGNIWVSHAYVGLFKLKLDLEKAEFTEIKKYDRSKGLPNELMLNVANIRNEIVITTQSGIFKYNANADSLFVHEEFTNIFGPKRLYHRLLEDNKGNIWFSIEDEFGVLKIVEKGLSINYGIKYFNHLQDELVDGFECIHAIDSNQFYIGTEDGFLLYKPTISKKNFRSQLPILIREVVLTADKDSIVFQNISTDDQKTPITFGYQQNDFKFSYTSPYFIQKEYIKYSYRLNGFDDRWSEWSPKSEKEFTNLSPGNYNFEVRAKNTFGDWSGTANFGFTIKSPWYETNFAKFIYLIISSLLLFYFYRRVVKKEQLKSEVFRAKQVQKLKDKEALYKKEVEKSENEIVNLKNEKLQSDIKHKNSQLASATMHLVQKSEILMKVKNELKEIENENPELIKKKIRKIARTIESDIQLDDSWEQFETYFDQVHENFFKRLRQQHPELTPKDQKLCAYLRMNLSTKEIAPLLNISIRGVEISRYRLRKKLKLDKTQNLVSFILEV